MFELDDFVIQNHRKIIDHYRWLRDTAKTEIERDRFEQRIAEEYLSLNRCFKQTQGALNAA